MKLSYLLRNCVPDKLYGDEETEITAITCNAKDVKEGALFIPLKGFGGRGHPYLAQGLSHHPAAVVVSGQSARIHPKLRTAGNARLVPENYYWSERRLREHYRIPAATAILVVQDVREAYFQMAALFYHAPWENMRIIGITGTKGKTTVAFLLFEIFRQAGLRVGMIGTNGVYFPDGSRRDCKNTTPELDILVECFVRFSALQTDFVMMEISSQALRYGRVQGFRFDCGIFTNLSRDHIGPREHATFADYVGAKAKLFDRSACVVYNRDDALLYQLMRDQRRGGESTPQIASYGRSAQCLWIRKTWPKQGPQGAGLGAALSWMDGSPEEIYSLEHLPGDYNGYNLAAACLTARRFGISKDIIRAACQSVRVPGRTEFVRERNGAGIYIDYAHNGYSMEHVLTAMKAYCRGHLIVVFGCGGTRARDRRMGMGYAAGRHAWLSVLTADNSREEPVEHILEEIACGVRSAGGTYRVIPDRREAIRYAVETAAPGDLVLILGKGHEQYMEEKGKKIKFDEREIIAGVR